MFYIQIYSTAQSNSEKRLEKYIKLQSKETVFIYM